MDGAFKGPIELGKRLASSSQVQQCVTKQWFRYALGRIETDLDACTLESVYQRFKKSDFILPGAVGCPGRERFLPCPPRRGAFEMKSIAQPIRRSEKPMPQLTLRSLLSKGVAGGLAAGLSPLMPILEGRAKADTLPKRLLLIYWSGGTAFGPYMPMGTETNWTLPPQLKALEPYKSKLTFYANIRRAQDNSKGSHQAGTSGIWTAARMLGTGTSGWVSHPFDRRHHPEGGPAAHAQSRC